MTPDETRLRWQRRLDEWGPLRELPDHRQRGLRAMWEAEDQEAADHKRKPGPRRVGLAAIIRAYLELEAEGLDEPSQEAVAERARIGDRHLRRVIRTWPPF